MEEEVGVYTPAIPMPNVFLAEMRVKGSNQT